MLSGKFIAAKLPQICVGRAELLHTFKQQAEKNLVYVSAPAGYGKTVSALLWLADSHRETLWVGLDRYDNTLPVFYKLFCTAIASIQPRNKALAEILTSPSFAAAPVEHTIALLSEFVPDGKKYALVLDDFHLVTNPEIRRSGLLAQKRLPSSFVTLILTRNEVRQEDAAIIDAQDLAFSPEEIQKYFNAYGHAISEEEAAAVRDITGGWAFGVKALSAHGQIKAGQNSVRALADYLKEQVWDQWDGELQDFALRTSLPESITAELAVTLTGREDSGEILEKLCAQNSFISHTGNGVYCYHPLFLGFLRDIRVPARKNITDGLYKKVADHYLAQGDLFTAGRYAIRSGEATAIIDSIYALLNSGKNAPLEQYVDFYLNLVKDPLPKHVCDQHPYIYALYVWYYFLIGDAAQMEHYLDIFYQYLPQIIQEHPQFCQSALLILAIDHRVGFMQQLKRFQSTPAQMASLTIQLPYAHRSLRDFCELADSSELLRKTPYEAAIFELHAAFLYERNLLPEALEAALQTQTIINDDTPGELVFCAFIHLSDIYFAMGKGHLLVDVVKQAEQYLEQSGAYHLNANLAAFKTKLLLADGDKIAARAWLDNYAVTEPKRLELYKSFQHFTTARAYLVLAQTDKAMRYILKLKKLGADFNRPQDIAEASVLQAILHWSLGSKKEAQSILESSLASMQKYGFIRVFADEGAAVLPILKKLALEVKRDTYQGTLDQKFLHTVTVAAYEQSKRHQGVAANIQAAKPVSLSKQQKNIVSLLAKGYKNGEIVEQTGRSIHTVKSHCAAVYRKLEVNCAMDAVLKARELGLLE